MKTDEDVLRLAQELMETGKVAKARRLLAPLLERDVAAALYLDSCMSPQAESEELFRMRRLRQLHRAAMLGSTEAMYGLGVCHEVGDGVMRSLEIASAYFRRAAETGHPRAMLSHGLDLLRGSNGIAPDRERGREYLRRAGALGEQAALEELRRLDAPHMPVEGK
jgi:TPR repeat protein